MSDITDLWTDVSKALEQHGIDFVVGDGDIADCSVMCLTGDMKTTVAEMGRTSRDQVVMVRIDEDTKNALDDWVETGAVKSRSEAAALFMREGIKIRSGELEQLREALDDVGRARQRLEEKAKQVIGELPGSDTTN